MKTLSAIAAYVMLTGGLAMERATMPQGAASLLAHVDHVVYAAPDLDAAVGDVYKRLGVRATPGGQHPGRGTRNALIALGPTSYLEIIGPDPAQAAPSSPRTFGIDTLKTARLVTWAAKGQDLDRLRRDAAARGIQLGEVGAGSRRRPDGVMLSWNYTSPLTVVADGIVPFFIDWGASPHPSQSAATGATLVDLRAEHPEADKVRGWLRQLGLEMPVTRASTPALVAVIAGPAGRVELR
jgi:hypothetical protein